MKINLTSGQWIALVVGILSATAGATAQLTSVFGATAAQTVVSVVNLVMTVFVSPILFVVTGQSGLVKQVQAMPGVDSIVVNKNANSTLAGLAIDQAQTKVDIAPGAETIVNATAKT